MTPSQLRLALESLGLTQAGAAPLLGAKPRTVRHWLTGDREIPDAVAILIRLLLNETITQKDIEKTLT